MQNSTIQAKGTIVFQIRENKTLGIGIIPLFNKAHNPHHGQKGPQLETIRDHFNL
jgi:hypothetical protein